MFEISRRMLLGSSSDHAARTAVRRSRPVRAAREVRAADETSTLRPRVAGADEAVADARARHRVGLRPWLTRGRCSQNRGRCKTSCRSGGHRVQRRQMSRLRWTSGMVTGRSTQAFKTRLTEGLESWRDDVEVVAMDKSTGFKMATTTGLPDAVAVMGLLITRRPPRLRCRCRSNKQSTAPRPQQRPLYATRRTLPPVRASSPDQQEPTASILRPRITSRSSHRQHPAR